MFFNKAVTVDVIGSWGRDPWGGLHGAIEVLNWAGCAGLSCCRSNRAVLCQDVHVSVQAVCRVDVTLKAAWSYSSCAWLQKPGPEVAWPLPAASPALFTNVSGPVHVSFPVSLKSRVRGKFLILPKPKHTLKKKKKKHSFACSFSALDMFCCRGLCLSLCASSLCVTLPLWARTLSPF